MQFKCQKQFYFKLFSLVNKIKWFQVLLCITNNLIKLAFVYTQENVKTILFQTIYWNLSVISRKLVQGYLTILQRCSQCILQPSPTDWATSWKSVSPLQRCSRYILQPLPTEPFVERVFSLGSDAAGVSYSRP